MSRLRGGSAQACRVVLSPVDGEPLRGCQPLMQGGPANRGRGVPNWAPAQGVTKYCVTVHVLLSVVLLYHHFFWSGYFGDIRLDVC